MFAVVDAKLIFAVLSTAITIAAFYPYIRDILLKKTQPHAYTWLIWAVTQGTATAALLYGGGNMGAYGLTAGTILVFAVFLLSLKFGTTNVTRSDLLVLATAILAIVIWWQLNDPVLAVIMVSAIDGLGYIPTYRKSFAEPWSETLIYWVAVIISAIFALLASAEYNILTMLYLATLIVAEIILVTLCIVRRQSVAKPAVVSRAVIHSSL